MLNQSNLKRSGEHKTSISKALSILTFVGESGDAGLAEIATETGYPKSTLLRLLRTMIDKGFVRKGDEGKYQLTFKAWRIGASAIDYDNVTRRITPMLQKLVELTGETAHYSIYDNGKALYVDKLDGHHPVRAYTAIGKHSPAHVSATGKVLLAWQQAQEISRVAASARSFTPTSRTGEAIIEHSAHIRECGYAVNEGEWRSDVWGIAAPVFGEDGLIAGAIGISGPETRIKPRLEILIQTVIPVAAKSPGRGSSG